MPFGSDDFNPFYWDGQRGYFRRRRFPFLKFPFNVIAFLMGIGILFGGVTFFANGYQGADTQARCRKYNDMDYVRVKEIDRTCYWNEDYRFYYDQESGCSFRYNDRGRYHRWQYWYDDISTDFEDGGWMEYDAEEDQWYIEKKRLKWIKLPEEYDVTELWHIDNLK